jgi:transcriptional regulator with XRE-family HTH domain
MQEPKRQTPFRTLGSHLRDLRESRSKSLAEVSGAIEIDADTMERIEMGEERPSEDLLMLLINYFDLQDHEAVKLWDTAGYIRDNEEHFHIFEDPQTKIATILLALDVRVMYSDGIAISSNDKGVVMNFLQRGGQEQSLVVSRVGMSYPEATEVLRELELVILRHKYLPKTPLLSPGDTL